MLSSDFMGLEGPTTLDEDARSALECGSSSYRLRFMRQVCKAVAAATALQGAFGTTIWC